nr:transposase [Lacrimispora amygdalina]
MPEKGKQYMWVYHSSERKKKSPVFLHEYAGTRGTAASREFLKGYRETLVTDGYQVYHTLVKERTEDLKVAGCWAHIRRRYAEIIKAGGKKDLLLLDKRQLRKQSRESQPSTMSITWIKNHRKRNDWITGNDPSAL